jgi:hypothetical protein
MRGTLHDADRYGMVAQVFYAVCGMIYVYMAVGGIH